MIITELIENLEKAKEKYGDIVVARFNNDWEQGDYHKVISKIIYKKNTDLLVGKSSTETYIYLK